MIQKNHIDTKNVITALSGKFVSNRLLKLPLPAKQISKVLPFEIENYIPFPLEDLIIDHHIIQASKQETVCLVAVAQKSIIESHLQLLKRAGVDPSFITFDSIALYNLNPFVGVSPAQTYAIVDIGHQKTSICIVSNQKVSLIRTLYTGGRDLDEAIRSEMNLTLEQANEVKEKHGILELNNNPLKSGDLQRLSGSIKGVINPLFQEIFQSFHLFRSQDWIPSESHKIEHVLFCGGTSLLRNLPEYFTQLLAIPSQRLYLLENKEPERASRPKEPLFATAVGIGMKISGRGKNASLIESINFRKGDYSFSKSLGDFQDKIIFYSKWVLVIFVLAFLQLLLKNNDLRHRNNVQENAIINEVKKIIPEDKSKTSKSAIKKLETKVQELQSKQDVLTAGLSKTTALGILRHLSVLIPQDIHLDTKELSIEGTKITMRGDTDTFSSVDQIMAHLQTFPEFSRVEKGDIRDTPDGKKSFQITIFVGDQDKKNEGSK